MIIIDLKITRINNQELAGPRVGIGDNTTFGFSGQTDVSVQKIYNDITITGTVQNSTVSKIEIDNVIRELGNPVKIITKQPHNFKDTDTIKIENVGGTISSSLNTDDHVITVENDTTFILNNVGSNISHTYLDDTGIVSIVDGSQDKRRLTVFYADDRTAMLNEVDLLLPIGNNLTQIVALGNANTELTGKNIEFDKTSDNRLIIKRTNSAYSSTIRLGVSDNHDFGFTNKNDVLVTEKVIDSELVLSEIISAINNANITNVAASDFESRLRLTKALNTDNPEDTILTLSFVSSGIQNLIGVSNTVRRAAQYSTSADVNVDLMIGDVVSDINEQNIENLTASQENNQLVITFSGNTLDIGSGTANENLGLISNIYYSQTNERINQFDSNDWIKIKDLANISILILNSVSTTTNRTAVFHTVDLDIGVNEICPGNRNRR